MNRLLVAAVEVQAFCTQRGWRSAVIGGLAVQRWGNPRQTRDVDLTLLTGLGNETPYVDSLLDQFRGRIADARRFALDRRVLLIEASNGIPIDMSLGGLPFEERVIERSTDFPIGPRAAVRTCSAEDLVILKAFADRPQDWIDIEGIVVRQGKALNRALVLNELRPLLDLKEDVVPEATLRKLFVKHPVP